MLVAKWIRQSEKMCLDIVKELQRQESASCVKERVLRGGGIA